MKANKFQVWKSGKPVDGYSYDHLVQACLDCLQAPGDYEVVEVDAEGKIIRRVPEDECKKAVSR